MRFNSVATSKQRDSLRAECDKRVATRSIFRRREEMGFPPGLQRPRQRAPRRLGAICADPLAGGLLPLNAKGHGVSALS